MKSKTDFWLTLHKLADDLEREGATDDVRATALIEVLEATSQTGVAVYLENLERVTASLNYLLARCKER